MQSQAVRRSSGLFRTLSRGVQTSSWTLPTAPGGTLKVRLPTVCTLRVRAADPQGESGWNAASVALHVEPRQGASDSISDEEAKRVAEGFGLRVAADYEPGKNFLMVETPRASTPESLARLFHVARSWIGGPFRSRRPQYDSNVVVDVCLPGKYNLDVEVEDGVVDIQDTFEGDVKIISDYANININRLKSLYIDVEAGEGDLQAVVLQGNVTVRSTSGNIDVAKVQGPSFMLRTRDGDVQARAIYADYTNMRTISGNVRLGGVQGKTRIRTTEGNIEVAGVEGKLDIESDCGDVEAQVSMPETVSLRTRNGDIAVAVPPALVAKVLLEAANDIAVDPSVAVHGNVPVDAVKTLKAWIGGVVDAMPSRNHVPKTIYARAPNGDVSVRPGRWAGLGLAEAVPGNQDSRFPRWAAAYPPPTEDSESGHAAQVSH